MNPEGARSFRSAAELIADLWQHRKIERYEGRSSLRTWLATVVAHAAVNAGKAARTRARHAHRRVEEEVGARLARRAQGELEVGAVHGVAGLEGDHLAPTQAVELGA